MGATGSSQSPQSAPVDPRLRPLQGGWDWGPEKPEGVPMATAAVFQGTLGTPIPRHPKRSPRLLDVLTPAYTSQHRGGSWVSGTPGKDPSPSPTKGAEQVRTGGLRGPSLPSLSPAPASCVYLPLGQGRPSKYRPDRLPLVSCAEILAGSMGHGMDTGMFMDDEALRGLGNLL